MKTLRDRLYTRTKYWVYDFNVSSQGTQTEIIDTTFILGRKEPFLKQYLILSISHARLLYAHLKRFFAAIGEEQQESVFVLQDDENAIYGIFWDIEGAIREAQRYAPAEKIVYHTSRVRVGDVFTITTHAIKGAPPILSTKENR